MPSKYRNFMLDVEADGQCPGFSNMTEFGVVCIEDPSKVFHSGLIRPILIDDDKGPNGQETYRGMKYLEMDKAGLDPYHVMQDFSAWLFNIAGGERPFMWSDNNGWDYQWINWYFHHAGIPNPFGHTSSNLGSFYKGLVRNVRQNFKHLRVTVHDHNPIHDSEGNVQALRTIIKDYDVKGIWSERE